MYEEYWGLNRPPFENLPDANLFFRSSVHEEGLIRLLYTVKRSRGAMLLTGEIGSGKTTLIKNLTGQLDQEAYRAVLIENPLVSANAMLSEILLGFGRELARPDKLKILRNLREQLHENATAGKGSVVIIDEAHLQACEGIARKALAGVDKLGQAALGRLGRKEIDDIHEEE